MMVSCNDVEVFAEPFCHDDLPENIMEALTAHLETCKKNCRVFIDRYRDEYDKRVGRNLQAFEAYQDYPVLEDAGEGLGR